MTTADLHKVLAGYEPYVIDLADALTAASRLGHILKAEERPQDDLWHGLLVTCSRCGAVAAWMPGQRLAHRGSAAVWTCAELIRQWIEVGIASPDQRGWLAEHERVS